MSGTHIADPCATDGICIAIPAEFVRLRYFFGQRLGVVDLADEQSYFAGKQRFHNSRAHGAGVLCGLTAERYLFPQGSPATNPTTLLRVRHGAALDACGREIVVGWDQCIDVAAWFAQHPEAQPGSPGGGPPPQSLRLWVALCYRECPSDPAPAPRDPCGCDAGGCEFARIREGFQLKLLTDDEAKLLAPGGYRLPGGEWHPEEFLGGPLTQDLARRLALIAGAACPDPPANPCLLLANFTATLDATGKTVADISVPDNTIPERLSVLPTALLQEGVLLAFAAAGDAEQIGSGPTLGTVTFTNAGADSGTLSIEIRTDGADLSRNPLDTPAQLTAKVFRFKDDGSWEETAPTSAAYSGPPSPYLALQWTGGLADGGRYRVLIESDREQPPVDTKMRPLRPLSWARHFRLVKDAAGNLVLADTLY
jgi:hypothetical protein